MAELVARHDWASTPLGAQELWPQSLRTAVDLILGSGHAMQLAWGPDRTIFYNDAYAPMLGERHPSALGLPFREAWPEIWQEIEPLVVRVFSGETVRFEDMPLVMTRHGYPEDTWWNFSYSPVRGEDGSIAGLLNVTVDATPRMQARMAEEALRESEELQGFLLKLSDALRPLEAPDTIMETATRLLNRQLSSNRCAYYEIEGDEYVIREDSAIDVPSVVGRYPREMFGSALFEKHSGGETLIVVEDVSATHTDEEVAGFSAISVAAYLAMTLFKQGRFVCGLTVHSREPRTWTANEIKMARETAERTWSAVERRRAESEAKNAMEHQALLLAELQHRVRNILAVVRSVFTRTAETERTVPEVTSHFTGRLDALARTQILVTQSLSGLVDLEAMVREEMLSVGSAENPLLIVTGPEVALPPKQAEAIGLAIHELTTNAIKYGALGQSGGALEISWSVNMDHRGPRRLVLNWIEQGVPAVPVIPSNQGFGSELIRDALPYRLGAETELEFVGGGVRCRIALDLPVEAKVIG